MAMRARRQNARGAGAAGPPPPGPGGGGRLGVTGCLGGGEPEGGGGEAQGEGAPEEGEVLRVLDGAGGEEGPALAGKVDGGHVGIGPDDGPRDEEDAGEGGGDEGPASARTAGERKELVESDGGEDGPGELEEMDEFVGVSDDGEAGEGGEGAVEGREFAKGEEKRGKAEAGP